MPSPLEEPAGTVDRAFIDLHCHTSASFDSLASRATSFARLRAVA